MIRKTLSFIGLISMFSCGIENKAELTTEPNVEPKYDTITVLQTADIHGQLNVHDELFWEDEKITFKKLGGLAHLKTLFDEVKKSNPGGTIILDGGDMIQGGAVAALSKGKAFSPIIREMGYDFLIPGNWEVVYGKETMIEVLTDYNTPVIAANIYDDETEKLIFPPYFIKEVKGLKLGFISYDDPEVPIRQNPSFSKGLRFDKIHDNLDELVSELKDNQGVDVLFLVTHLGISKQMNLANDSSLKRVDFVLGNDTHERIRNPLQGKHAKLTEPGAFASFVGRLDLIVKDGKVVKEEYELMEVDPIKYAADPTIKKIIEEQSMPYNNEIKKVLGYTSEPLYRYFVVENPMDNFITDAARWKTGVDISFSNGFRFSPPINVEANGKAAITNENLWNMLPVNEYVKTGKASGNQIKNWLEQEIHTVFAENPSERFGGWLIRFSGMDLKFNAKAPKGSRIVSINIGGETLQPHKIYTLSACRREGEPDNMLCRMPNVKDTKIHNYTIHDLLTAYLATKGTIAPTIDGRAKALDLGDNVLSQLPGTDYNFY